MRSHGPNRTAIQPSHQLPRGNAGPAARVSQCLEQPGEDNPGSDDDGEPCGEGGTRARHGLFCL